jgi:hypothetical protein
MDPESASGTAAAAVIDRRQRADGLDAERLRSRAQLGSEPSPNFGRALLIRAIATGCRIRTKARMISMFTCTAFALRYTLDSIATPCSVKTHGSLAPSAASAVSYQAALVPGGLYARRYD